MQKILAKQAASKGIAFGKAFLFEPNDRTVSQRLIGDDQKPGETARFREAVSLASQQLGELAQTSEIFAAHLEILEDPTLLESVLLKINDENKNAELALDQAKDDICALFAEIEDEYLRERSADIRDVCSRILKVLKGDNLNPFDKIDCDVIVVADDLAPSDTALMDFKKVRGLITRSGGPTSHVCIIAKNKGIPAVVGMGNDLPEIDPNDFILLDGLNKEIIINPDEQTLKISNHMFTQYCQQKEELLKMRQLEAQTPDGHKVHLVANAGSVEDIEQALQNGASGIGLFRSEFLYMQSKLAFPDEETQFAAYRKAVEACRGKSIIIRTLDIGGDKSLPYFPMDHEDNPFLGWRAIRISLERTDIFRTQLRALLRASAFGPLKIMFPMIISVEEFRQARCLLECCKSELREEGLPFDENIETGLMIETPAAVMMAVDLAREADFFSIGTNDLTQYTLAADRLNTKIASLYNPLHPAVIRSVKQVIDAATLYKKPVGMCGELAGMPEATQLLLGLGLTEFSVAATDIPEIKQRIRNINYNEAQKLAAEACSKSTAAEINTLLESEKLNEFK